VLESRNRLMQQHAKSVDHPVAPGPRRREQRRLERAIDDVGHDRVLRQRRQIDVERFLAVQKIKDSAVPTRLLPFIITDKGIEASTTSRVV
jgi:hypothetical protein